MLVFTIPQNIATVGNFYFHKKIYSAITLQHSFIVRV